MKNYLMSSVSLGLLLFSLPVLAMVPQDEDKTGAIAVGQSSTGKIVFPREMLRNIVKDINKDFDFSKVFYQHGNPDARKRYAPDEVRKSLLTLRCTSRYWKASIEQIFNEIPIMRKECRTIDPSTPHFISVMQLNLNLLNPDEVQTKYKLLALPESSYKNLVSFELYQSSERPRGPLRPITKDEIKLLGDVLESRANTLKYLTIDFPLNKENAESLSERLPKLENLEYLSINVNKVDLNVREHLIHTLAYIPSLKNIHVIFSDDLECNAMATALRKEGSLPNLKNVLLYCFKHRELPCDPRGYFCDSLAMGQGVFDSGRRLNVDIKTNLQNAIQEHPKNETIQWHVWR